MWRRSAGRVGERGGTEAKQGASETGAGTKKTGKLRKERQEIVFLARSHVVQGHAMRHRDRNLSL